MKGIAINALKTDIIESIQRSTKITLTPKQVGEILKHDLSLSKAIKRYRSFDTSEREHFMDAMSEMLLGPGQHWPLNGDGDQSEWYARFASAALYRRWQMSGLWTGYVMVRWASVSGAAKSLGISRVTLLKAINSGALQCRTFFKKFLVNLDECRNLIDDATWRGADGRLIKIPEMNDDHLLRTLSTLSRNRKRMYQAWLEALPSQPPGWMKPYERAGAFSKKDAEMLCPDATAFLDRHTRYPLLLAEAKGRRLL